MDNLDKWLEKPYTDEQPEEKEFKFMVRLDPIEVTVTAYSENEAQGLFEDNMFDYLNEKDFDWE